MSARTTTLAKGRSQKPQNTHKSQAVRADQQRSRDRALVAEAPQKSTHPPHKSHPLARSRSDSPAALNFCGTSHAFCDSQPPDLNAADEPASPHLSAVSAVSAAGVPLRRLEGRPLQLATAEEMDTTLALLSVEEAARRLGIGRTVCYRLISSGELESVTVGRLRRVPADAIPEYVTRLRQSARSAVGTAA